MKPLAGKGEQARKQQEAASEAEKRLQEQLSSIQAEKQRINDMIEAFAVDPAKAYEATGRDPKHLYERMQRMVLDKEGTQKADKIASMEAKIAQLEREIEAKLEAKIAPLAEFREQQAQAARQAEEARLSRDFAEFVGRNEAKFPVASRVDGDQLARDFWGALKILEDKGEEPSFPKAANAVNSFYEQLANRLGAAPQTAATPKQPNSTAPRSQRAPDTLTNREGAEQARESAMTVEDRIAAAISQLESSG